MSDGTLCYYLYRKESSEGIVSFIKEHIRSLIMIIAGAVIAAFAVEDFLLPNEIFDGGVVGISMIVASFLDMKLGILTVLINIPFLLYAYSKIGHRFIVKAAIAMAVFSVATGFFEEVDPPTSDKLLATVFGGIILGIGVGLVLRSGACLDGTEIVGIIINKKFAFSVGTVVLAINIVIYSVAGAIYGVEAGMYSMIMYFLTSKVIDMVEVGLEQAKSVMIVTEDGKKIADEIYDKFGRTVTFIRGEGFVSGTSKDILYCVVTRAEIYDLRKLIKGLDVTAFTTISDVSEIIGNHVKKRIDLTEEAAASEKNAPDTEDVTRTEEDR